MNELFQTTDAPAKSRSGRRWIYLSLAALVAVGVSLMMPKERTVRFSLVAAPDNAVELQIRLPEKCHVQSVYLRGTSEVPRTGALFTLVLNGKRFPVADWEKLSLSAAAAEPGSENRLPVAELPDGGPHAQWVIACENIAPAVRRGALEVVFEVTGPSDTVQHWNEMVTLVDKTAPPPPQF